MVPDGPPERPRCFVREPQRLFVCLLPAASRGVRAEPGAAGAGKEVRNVPSTERRAVSGVGRNPPGLRRSVPGLLAERLMRGLRK